VGFGQGFESVVGRTGMGCTALLPLVSHISVAQKFTKLCNMIEGKIRNNFPFGQKFKFQIEFELKFLEVKLLLNLP
jgi:hypothetical protein